MGVALAVWWLFYDARPPDSGDFPLDIAALRAESGRLGGAGPSRIEVETVYRSQVPRIAMVTGTDWGDLALVRTSYRLVFADRSIILDTANDAATARQDKWLTSYDEGAWQRMQAGLSNASMILVTHEHCDHIGGLLQSPAWQGLLPKAVLNEEQFRNVPHCTVWPKGSRAGFRPIAYRGIHAVAPGVVLIRAPGHTRGSQMVYVRRADGHEFLFMGDTASLLDNVRLLRPRSRYVMLTGGHEDDRSAIFRQTIAIRRLMDSAQRLTLVPGHDAAAIRSLEQQGLLASGFSIGQGASGAK